MLKDSKTKDNTSAENLVANNINPSKIGSKYGSKSSVFPEFLRYSANLKITQFLINKISTTLTSKIHSYQNFRFITLY